MKKILLVIAILFMTISVPLWADAETPSREIFAAIQRGDLDRVILDLPKLADPRVKDFAGNSLIHALLAPRSIIVQEPPRLEIQGSPLVTDIPQIISEKPMKAIGDESDLDKRMGIIRQLVSRGVPINGMNDRGETPLHLAVQPRIQLSILPWKVFQGEKCWEREPDPVQAERLVKFLLAAGADTSLRDARGNSPSFLASQELLPLMIRKGSITEERDSNGMTLFLKADLAKAMALLALGADPMATDNKGRNRWFFLPVDPRKELAEMLLALQVPINQRDSDGRSALMSYAEKEKFDQARFLIEHGIDINVADNKGITALHEATLESNVQLMELLLKKGAAVDARSKYGQTPLHLSRFDKEGAMLLLRYKADPGIANLWGENVLHDLVMRAPPHYLEMLSLFIRHGAPLNQKNSSGHTPLSLAYTVRNTKAMEMLLKAGADPSISEYPGSSLLDQAVREPNRDMFNLLSRYGARHKRPWTERHRLLLIYGYIGLGIFPLFTFFFSLLRLTPFTKRILWILAFPAATWLLLMFVMLTKMDLISGGDDFLWIFGLPPLAAMLMSLSGTRALTDRVSPWLGISLSFLNAAGCMGLTLGIAWLYFPSTHGEGGMALAIDALYGGGAAAVVTLIFAFVIWKKRLTREKSGNG